jgi:hypothetical protein
VSPADPTIPPTAPATSSRAILGAVEGIRSVLKRGVLANLAVASFAHLVQVIRHGLKKIQYQPRLTEGCLTGTGLTLKTRLNTQRPSRIKFL